jgi:hypothetical protein
MATAPSKAKPPVTTSAGEDLPRYFERMGRALTAGDGPAIARMWDVPALVIGDQEVHAVATRKEVEQFFGGAKDQYNARGITDTRPEIAKLEWVTDRIVLVTVRWPYLDSTGEERGEETSTYTLRRDDNGELKLRVAVMHGAVEP